MSDKKYGEYLKTTRPRGWILLCSVVLLMLVFIFWISTDRVLDIQKISLIATEEGVYGCIEISHVQEGTLHSGLTVVINKEYTGSVSEIDHMPYNPQELEEKFGAAVVRQLDLSEYCMLLSIDTDAELIPATVKAGWLVIGEVRPIHLWFYEELKK